ncbi:MAG: hypothetical protein HOO96_03645 [Polyangiaceae bacterium]|nr:hypothetical protein [Polyangiaceae bacterium]
MQAWEASVGVCRPHVLLGGRARFGVCASLAGALLSATGLGLQVARTAAPLLVGAKVEASLHLRAVGPLYFGLLAAGVVPFGEHRFFATHDATLLDLHETWPVIPTVGLEVRVEGGR